MTIDMHVDGGGGGGGFAGLAGGVFSVVPLSVVLSSLCGLRCGRKLHPLPHVIYVHGLTSQNTQQHTLVCNRWQILRLYIDYMEFACSRIRRISAERLLALKRGYPQPRMW